MHRFGKQQTVCDERCPASTHVLAQVAADYVAQKNVLDRHSCWPILGLYTVVTVYILIYTRLESRDTIRLILLIPNTFEDFRGFVFQRSQGWIPKLN